MSNKATALSISLNPFTRKVEVAYFGTDEDLINLLAVAMDDHLLRQIFYRAVQLDKEHDEVVGRKQDL